MREARILRLERHHADDTLVTAVYSYRAVDASGAIVDGTLVGEDPDRVADRVRRMGLRPLRVRRRRADLLHRELSVGLGGKRADALASLSRQFATMISAGTSLSRSLAVLTTQAKDPNLARILEEISTDVANGDQLSEAISHHPQWFDEFYVSMVRAGESSGSLGDVLERLADATETAVRLRRRIRSAMAYPTAVAGLIGLTTIAMLVFLIPTFEGIYEDLDGELPVPTKIVIGLSNLLTTYLPIVATVALVGYIALRRWRHTDAGRLKWDRARMRLPVFGKLITQTALARFSRSLAVLVSTGVPVVPALRIARSTGGNRAVAAAVDEVTTSVSNGSSLAAAMEEQPVFTAMVTQMVLVGEETGELDTLLTKVADQYEQDVDSTVEGLTSLLEPLLIVMMGLTVGGLLLAVYLPMFRAIELVK